MPKFSDITYKRPDLDKIEEQFNTQLKLFKSASSADDQNAVLKEINAIRNSFMTHSQVAHIRNTIDTRDEFYDKEQAYFDQNEPRYQALVHKLYQLLVDSPYRTELEAKWGGQLFAIAEASLKSFSPEIIGDLQRENELKTQYTKLVSSAKIMFDGEECTMAELTPFEQSADREVRKRASAAKFGFLAEHEDEFDAIYDELVKVRDGMAKKLGFENFVSFGYARLTRTDYDAEKVAYYREQIRKYVVPVATKMRERQRVRLGLDTLRFYDENINFKDGNAKPQGSADWIVAHGESMYRELSPETGEFFDFMIENEMMDLEAKKGKAPGGYCTFINEMKSPYIFSNFNGTSGDIDVLTHEAGHAFQVYMSRDYEVPEYNWPTYEACEIHSMSMEFFTWPWMKLFFNGQTDKYQYTHLGGSLLFLPYGVSVDEFQHWVYENPTATAKERKQQWRVIEKKYLPHRNYEGNDYLEGGGYWHKQAHIFHMPFYYIDYTLAQVCAFQFWSKANTDQSSAWADYVRLCKAGGSKAFLDLVDLAGLKSPFEQECVPEVIEEVDCWLEAVDDTQL